MDRKGDDKGLGRAATVFGNRVRILKGLSIGIRKL
jgi:hypothetical protein